MRTCTRCEDKKPASCFWGARKMCIRCTRRHRIDTRKWRAVPANREKHKAWTLRWQKSARGRRLLRAYHRSDARRSWHRRYVNRRWKCDPDFRGRLLAAQRRYYETNPQRKIASRILMTVKRAVVHGHRPRFISVGCTPEQLRAHFERQFDSTMTWANHGRVWRIQYVVPLHRFNLTLPGHVALATHYTNLRPARGKAVGVIRT